MKLAEELQYLGELEIDLSELVEKYVKLGLSKTMIESIMILAAEDMFNDDGD